MEADQADANSSITRSPSTAAIVNTTGDGLLAEFASVVDAVRSAVEVQREMTPMCCPTVASKR